MEEIGTLIAVTNSLMYKVAFGLLGLGLRPQEVLPVRWDDITSDWTGVHIQRTVTRALGPGETKRVPKEKTSKSDAGDRCLPVSPSLATLLKKWRLQFPATALGLVLPNREGGILHHKTLYDALKRAQAATDVSRLDLMAFRHTFGTALIEGREADNQVAMPGSWATPTRP